MTNEDLRYQLWMRGLRLAARAVIRLAYRFDVRGIENVPPEGGVIIVMNHTSTHDWMFAGAAMSRLPRYVMHQHHFQYSLLRAFFEASRVIAIAPRKQDPARLDAALDEIDRALAAGEVVVMCPEGTMTPDGELSELKPGIERILARRPVPVVPVAITGLWGSALSRAYGPPLSTWPRRFRARVVLRAGAAMLPHEISVGSLHARLTSLLAGDESAPITARSAVAPAALASARLVPS